MVNGLLNKQKHVCMIEFEGGSMRVEVGRIATLAERLFK